MHERIIIKVGSSLLVDLTQKNLRKEVAKNLFHAIAQLQKEGHEVVFVCSGAVATGKMMPQLKNKQARAAHGQWMLNATIAPIAESAGVPLGLLLISREDVVNRKRYLALQETINHLLAAGIVPLMNENDATTIKEKNDFPDNDHLAAILSATVQASKLFLLTNVDGVYTGDPTDPASEFIPRIDNVDRAFLKEVSSGKSSLGRGGMFGKLKAARLSTTAGVPTYILNGEKPEQMVDIVHGEERGTACIPRGHEEFTNRDRWIMAAHSSEASIQIDTGAAQAVREHKSLLAVGVTRLCGPFAAREAVEIIDENKELVAIGLASLSSKELEKLTQQKARPFNTKVVHANNMIIV